MRAYDLHWFYRVAHCEKSKARPRLCAPIRELGGKRRYRQCKRTFTRHTPAPVLPASASAARTLHALRERASRVRPTDPVPSRRSPLQQTLEQTLPCRGWRGTSSPRRPPQNVRGPALSECQVRTRDGAWADEVKGNARSSANCHHKAEVAPHVPLLRPEHHPRQTPPPA